MTNSITKYLHNGDQSTPYFIITGYTYETNRVEHWTYRIYSEDKTPVGGESKKFNQGGSAMLSVMEKLEASKCTNLKTGKVYTA